MSKTTESEPTIQSAPQLLLPEILGFSPQLVLDDIINIANNAVQDGINGMEEFLQKWADERAEREGGDWDSTQEVEQGLVSFQTLLEHHTDLAFDFFEAWSLRNVFAVPPDLPIVAPHHQGLDLTQTPEREQELQDEIEELRKKIDNQRRLKRLFTRAVRASNARRQRAAKRLERISFLESPALDEVGQVPEKLKTMFEAVSNLPPLDPVALASTSLADPGKRQWETSKTGYLNWATGQLMEKAKKEDSTVGDLMARVNELGHAEDLRMVAGVSETNKMNTDDTGTPMNED